MYIVHLHHHNYFLHVARNSCACLFSYRMLFSLYLLFMVFLTTALVLAARSGDPNEYDDSLDWFRLFCEVVTLLWILYDLTLEFYQLGQVV